MKFNLKFMTKSELETEKQSCKRAAVAGFLPATIATVLYEVEKELKARESKWVLVLKGILLSDREAHHTAWTKSRQFASKDEATQAVSEFWNSTDAKWQHRPLLTYAYYVAVEEVKA